MDAAGLGVVFTGRGCGIEMSAEIWLKNNFAKVLQLERAYRVRARSLSMKHDVCFSRDGFVDSLELGALVLGYLVLPASYSRLLLSYEIIWAISDAARRAKLLACSVD